MNKQELINEIAEQSGLTKKDATTFLETFIKITEETVANGEKVQLVGFGTFEKVERAEKKGRNPRTGEDIVIPPSNSVKFKVGKQFKDRVNNK
ncbi:HU family DNA-binding protein [uncultured Clostridium sp.]|uniref:HU family DNA-binding protein n=1 Tax=uncultured Clostridium sp. TaxID=59620 RepID=UPI00321772A5